MLMRILFQFSIVFLLYSIVLALPKQAFCNEQIVAEKTYQDIILYLDKDDTFLSYNDLLKIYEKITTSEGHIPGMEKILFRLMEKRNEHPRVDQMILIFTAKLIGSSKQELANVTDLLKALILNKRANLWTVSFAAAALGSYFIDIKDGEHLADMIDWKVERLIEKDNNSIDELYGFHFLPPPATEYIKNIISSPKEKKRRQLTRHYYYRLRSRNSEEQIKGYLLFLDKHGQIDTNRKIDFSMKYLLINLELIKAAIAKEQKGELSSGNRID